MAPCNGAGFRIPPRHPPPSPKGGVWPRAPPAAGCPAAEREPCTLPPHPPNICLSTKADKSPPRPANFITSGAGRTPAYRRLVPPRFICIFPPSWPSCRHTAPHLPCKTRFIHPSRPPPSCDLRAFISPPPPGGSADASLAAAARGGMDGCRRGAPGPRGQFVLTARRVARVGGRRSNEASTGTLRVTPPFAYGPLSSRRSSQIA